MTAAEQLTAEVRAKALAEGEALGEAKGQIRLLTRLLERRFGPLPTGVRQRLAQADEGQLERWADAVLTADSLEALLRTE